MINLKHFTCPHTVNQEPAEDVPLPDIEGGYWKQTKNYHDLPTSHMKSSGHDVLFIG